MLPSHGTPSSSFLLLAGNRPIHILKISGSVRYPPSPHLLFPARLPLSPSGLTWLLITLLPCLLNTAYAQITYVTVNSIAQLRYYATQSNVHVTMVPGEYWIGKNGTDRTLLRFSGSNSTYDLTGVTLKLDSRDLKGFGTGWDNEVQIIGIYGSNLTLQGFTLSTEYVNGTVAWADWCANSIRIGGTNNTLRNVNITTRGSYPYGYGDAFGKGTNPDPGNVPFISHHKHCGILVRDADNITIEGVYLKMETFGHGIYMQKASNIRILNSEIVGELASSNDVINHPLYQQYGYTVYGQPIPPNILISKSEDGVRSYGVIDGVPVTNVYVENVIVRNMREAFSLKDAQGIKTVINCEAWGNETGFEPGSNTTILNSRGDATNGPLLYFRLSGITNATVDLTLIQNQPQIGQTWDIAYISGTNNNIYLNAQVAPGVLSSDAFVRVAQRWNDWRHAPGNIDDGFSASSLSLINATGQDMVIGPKATSSGIYYVQSGDVLGGYGRIITSQQSSIRVNAGGKLDPQGQLIFQLGTGSLDISPAVASSNSKALLFTLGEPGTSDRIHTDSLLSIGLGVLDLGDFDFTPTANFRPGVFILLSSSLPISGYLGPNRTGTIEDHQVTLLALDNQTIALRVLPNLLGDTNWDGVVDLADYNNVVNNLGASGLNCLGDVNLDGLVDLADYNNVVNNLGAAAASRLVFPEPATLVVITLIAVPLSCRKNSLTPGERSSSWLFC